MAITKTNPFRWQRWIWPVLVGTSATAAIAWWGFQQEVIDPMTQERTHPLDVLGSFQWNRRSLAAVAGLLGCIVLRDLGYMRRLRILTHQKLSWRQTFDSIVLWELASALTPSVVGGSAAAIWILKREGMRWGKSIATVFATALMDELFYLVAVPLMFGLALFSNHPIFPEIPNGLHGVRSSLPLLFGLAYAFIAALTAIILWALVIRPEFTHRKLIEASGWNALRHWKNRIAQWADDLYEASQSLRSQSRHFWGQAFFATCFSWFARFATLNMVFLVFHNSVPHAALIARQLVLWLVLTISPTPGSSGAAELGLSAVTSDLMGTTYIVIVILLWRFSTYFLYLIMGAFVLPRWLLKTRNSESVREPFIAP